MRALLWVIPCSIWAQQNYPVSEIRLRTEPQAARIRPFESLQVQVKVYGDVPKKGGDGTEKGRLNKGGAKVRVVTQNGGWVSKPFKFQGRDDEGFYSASTSRFSSIFDSLTKDFLLQDTVLYTAGESAGRYDIEADLDGKTARITIEVDSGAPSLRPPERQTFGEETHKPDPYRYLAEYWAPFIAQETWFQPKSDMPARFDFDGDWQGDNNWDNMEVGSSQAYVHYAAMETRTHWFLIYNIWHPRDYSDKCVAGTCHENDNEGLIMTVRKDGSEYGKLEVVETLAHNNVYSFVNDPRIRNNAQDIDGKVEFYQGHSPVIFVESGGHGVYGTTTSHARYRFATDEFTAGTGITLLYKGRAERPRHANDRLVGYELLPIYDHWWLRGTEGANWRDRTFDEFYDYRPFGNRPGTPPQPGKISGAFYGRKQAANKARPFWGWFDNNTKKKNILNNGQWALDPAYAVSRDVRFPAGEEPSLEYTFNPYLGVE